MFGYRVCKRFDICENIVRRDVPTNGKLIEMKHVYYCYYCIFVKSALLIGELLKATVIMEHFLSDYFTFSVTH